jgi:hypothetical protein
MDDKKLPLTCEFAKAWLSHTFTNAEPLSTVFHTAPALKTLFIMEKIIPVKRIVLIACFCIITFSGIAQSNIKEDIDRINTPSIALAPLRFLASDELMGRATARPEINIAARYISEAFRSMQLQECPNTTDYFQNFNIKMITPATGGTFAIDNETYQTGTDIFQLNGEDINVTAPVAYIGFGSKEDFDKADIKGKIVITDFGLDDTSGFRKRFSATPGKNKLAKEEGAIALIQRINERDVPWNSLKQFTSREHAVTDENDVLPSFLLNDSAGTLKTLLQNKLLNATLTITGTQINTVKAKNVMGYIEGTDQQLKKQFIILSAHYDHLGVAKPKMEEGKLDSIYNGARDNAIGVTAVMDAARYFTQHPPERSVIFIAYTAEEIGEIGSKYFATHPVIPLNQIVYNLNIDNASYNDTGIVTVVGLDRTSAGGDFKKACAANGLTAMPDPVPEQNLFDRSDNVNLAEKGIPAPTFSLGFTSFDSTVTKRYHQMSDEVGNFNLSYAMKYIKAFILSAKYIADEKTQPAWMKSDKYEPAWKSLYQK